MIQNKNIIIYFIPVYWLLLLPASRAQTLNLYDAVTKTVDNYPLMRQRQAEIAMSKAHIRTVKGYKLPNFTLQEQLDLGTNNSLQGAYLTNGMIPSSPGNNNSSVQNNSPDPNNVALAFLQWEIFNFGYYHAQEQDARAQLAVNQANYGSERYMLTTNVIALYLDWLKKYRLLQIQREHAMRAAVILNAIRATVNAGLKPGVDSSTASAIYAEANISYLQAQEDYTNAQISVTTFAGVTNDVSPDTSLPQQDQPATSFALSVAPEHPLIQLYQRQYEQQLAANNAVSKKYFPHVALEGVTSVRSSGISYTGVYPADGFSGLPYSKYNYLLGATITVNLFDFRHRSLELTEGRYAAQARQNAVETQQTTLNALLRQTNAAYGTTRQKLQQVPMELHGAQQAYEQQLALYKAGLNTLVEVTNAQLVLLQAETNHVIIQDELYRLSYMRAALSGTIDNFLQTFKR